jgi:crotonobetainyl-CoA:carnitine CoA-transferase CaiB-like acyl-CoA transferase
MKDILPLDGIKVLDLNRFFPGQYAAMLLAEGGADVVKIEAPGYREVLFEILHREKPTEEAERAWDAVYVLDRSKKSLALNLRDDEAKDIFYRLAREADVIIEGNRPGVMKKLKLDYNTIKKINPGIVYCAITGYGQDGPYSMLPVRDLTCMAMSGVLGVVNEGDFPPMVPGVKISDASAAMYSMIGILMALAAREKTGKGQFVDVSMTDGALSWLAPPIMNCYYEGKVPDKGIIYLSGKRPAYNVYKTKDGKYISIALREAPFWKKLCEKLERPDLLPYQNPDAGKFDEIVSALQDVFLTKTRDEWFKELNDVGVGKIYQLDELESDPQIMHRQMIVEVDYPGVGKVKQTGNPIKLSDTPLKIKSLSPTCGQHTRDILIEAGYSREQIDKFYNKGIVA